MKYKPKIAIHMENPLLITVSWMGWSFRGSPEQDSVSQFDGESDIEPACQTSGSVGEGFRKGTMASVHLSVCKKVVPQLLP